MNLFDLVATLSLDKNNYDEGIKSAEEGINSLSAFAVAKGQLIGSAIEKGASALLGFAKESIGAGMSFDKAMGQVAATSNKSVDEISGLRDMALELGRTTKFTATESAEAMNIFAMAGYDANKTMSVLPQTLNLAAAGAMSIGEAADISTGLMAGFSSSGLKMEEAIDKLAVLAASAKGSVSDFGDAINVAGAMASSTGQNFDTMAVAAGILGNHNMSASEAGNMLNRTLRNLYMATPKATKALDKLGISAYDTATGKARPLQDVLIDLKGALGEMDEATKNATLSQIFNAATLKSVGFLIEESDTQWNSLAEAIDNSAGAAERMAKAQEDNLQGDITLFNSAVEGMQIAVADTLNGSLRSIVQFGTDAVSTFTDIFSGKGGFVDAIHSFNTIVIDALGGIAEGIQTEMPEKIAKALDSMWHMASNAAKDGVGIIDAIGGIISAMGTAIQDAMPSIEANVPLILNALTRGIINNASAIVDGASKLMQEFGKGFESSFPVVAEKALPLILDIAKNLRENAGKIVDAGIDLILSLVNGLIAGLPYLIEYIPEIVINIAGIINDNAPKLLEAGVKIIVALVQGIIENIPLIIENFGKIIEAIVAVITAFNWINLGSSILKAIGDGIKALASAPVQIMKEIFNNVVKTIKEGFSWAALGSNIIHGIIEGIKSAGGALIDALLSPIKSAVSNAKSFLKISSPSKLMEEEVGRWIPEGVAVGIEKNTKYVNSAMDDMLSPVVDTNGVNLAMQNGVTTGNVKPMSVTINVYGAEGQDESKIADEVMQRLYRNVRDEDLVYAW